MRWVVRYLSFVAAVAVLLAITMAVARAVLMTTERYGPVGLDGPLIADAAGGLGVITALVIAYVLPLVGGDAVGYLVFRTIAQFGWIHALPWWVVGVSWGLASALLTLVMLAVFMGYVTVFEGVGAFLLAVLTAGFGWHVFAQRWVHCPSAQIGRVEVVAR